MRGDRAMGGVPEFPVHRKRFSFIQGAFLNSYCVFDTMSGTNKVKKGKRWHSPSSNCSGLLRERVYIYQKPVGGQMGSKIKMK